MTIYSRRDIGGSAARMLKFPRPEAIASHRRLDLWIGVWRSKNRCCAGG